MKNTFANARNAYGVVIVAASLIFTTHAVQGAKVEEGNTKNIC